MISYKFSYAAALLLLITSNWNAAYGQESKKAQGRAKQLTVIMLIETEIKALKEEKINPESLESRMLRSPSSHQVKTKSEELLKNQYYEQLNNRVLKRLNSIPAEINTKEETWISDKWLEEQLETKYKNEISRIIKSLTGDPFTRAFETARDSAVEKQKKQVILDSYPTPVEIEEIDRNGRIARDRVVERLKSKMAGEIALFDESRDWLKTKIGLVVDDALDQLRYQRDFVRQNNAVNCFTEPKIKEKIKTDLDNNILAIRTRNAGNNKKIYDVFPTVDTSIPGRARELMETKFRDFVGGYKINKPRMTGEIETLIDKNPGLHKTLEMSTGKIEKKFIPELEDEIIEGYGKKAGGGKEFVKTLRDIVNSNEDIKRTFNSFIKGQLLESLTQAREKKAKEQLSPFGKVISGEWQPPENKITQYKKDEKEVKLPELVNLLSIKNGNRILENLLLESEEQLKSNITRLLEEGGKVLDRQKGIVDDLKGTVKDEITNMLKNKPDYNQLKPDQRMKTYKDEALGFYIKKIAEVWRSNRKDLIREGTFLDGKYLDLFEFTKAYARDVLTIDFFPDIKEPVVTDTPEKYSSEEPGGGGRGTGGGRGDEKGPGTGGGGGGGGGSDCYCPKEKIVLAIIVCEEGNGNLIKYVYYSPHHNETLLNEAIYSSARKLLFKLAENTGMDEHIGAVLRLLKKAKNF
jgi:hypothetical protein